MGVKTKDTGFSRYKQAMHELNNSTVEVGLFAEEGAELITYAGANEFGTNRAGKNRNITIPERSFLRATFDAKVRHVVKRFEQVASSIVRGNYSVKPKVKLIGFEMETAVKKAITDMKTPANAPSTIAQKGFNDPLIGKSEDGFIGYMRSRITSKVK